MELKDLSGLPIAEFILEDGFPFEMGNSCNTRNSFRSKFS